ncbi:MAG: hypothetical protein ACLU0Z_07200 [Oscillospiraceae bacterium]
MTYTPDTPLEALPGIGPKKAQAFQKLGVATLRDLAGLYPRRYEDRTQFRTIAAAQPGEAVCIRATVAGEPRTQYVRSGLTLVKARIADDTGALDVTYFNQPYRKNSLHAGEEYIFYGKVEANGFRKTLTNPVCEQAERCGSVTNCFYPIYPLTTGVTQNDVRKAMLPALHACIGQLQDVIPADIARTYALAQQDYALQNIHQPADARRSTRRASGWCSRSCSCSRRPWRASAHSGAPRAASGCKAPTSRRFTPRSPSHPPGRSGAPSPPPCRT